MCQIDGNIPTNPITSTTFLIKIGKHLKQMNEFDFFAGDFEWSKKIILTSNGAIRAKNNFIKLSIVHWHLSVQLQRYTVGRKPRWSSSNHFRNICEWRQRNVTHELRHIRFE